MKQLRNSSRQVLRIAINAQLLPATGAGGVESALIGLISALGRLQDGTAEYVIVGPRQNPDWLKPYMGPNQRLVRGPRRNGEVKTVEFFKNALGLLRPTARQLWRGLFPVASSGSKPNLPVSDGFYEGLGCDVIYFHDQEYVRCEIPTIYNPHDLQHRYYPEFFTRNEIRKREIVYDAGCRLAHTVVVPSQEVKRDITVHYGIDPEKIVVIPWASPTQFYPEAKFEELEVIRRKYGLPATFALYPAVIWPHKNHLRLLEALAYLRDHEELTLRLVCTGYRDTQFWPQVRKRLDELNLKGQVQFLGAVPPSHLRAIYRLAQFVIYPSLFEGGALPMFESWFEGTPFACSRIPMLVEQGGDSTFLFEPGSVDSIASAIRHLASRSDLRSDLVRRGKSRIQHFTWGRTARAYRAVYRHAAGFALTDEDRSLLKGEEILEAEGKIAITNRNG